MTPPARPLIPLALLVAALLAGCSGDPPKAAADEGLVDVGGVLVAADKGVVAGSVVSDAGLAVPLARVSVLGTDLFTDADERGRFLLANVSAGPAELQATHTSYKAHLHRLTVPAGQRVEVNLTLIALDSTGIELPHLHDHWGGQPTYVLLDQEVDLEKAPSGNQYPDEYWFAQGLVYRGNANITHWEVPIVETPHGGPALVLPGTAQLDVTVSWTEAITDGFGLCFDSADKDPARCLAPQASPAKFSIPVAPGMQDAGHQSYSLWRLTLYTRALTQGNGGNPDIIMGTADVQAVLTRGEVLVDPPHPDFWSQGNQRLFMDEPRAGSSTCCGPPGDFYPDAIVPPGTTKVRIEHTWVAEGAGANVPIEYRVAVRNAAMNPHTTTRADWLQPEPTEGSSAERRVVYEFDVQPGETDGYYQSSSFWRVIYFQPRYGPEQNDIVGYPIQHTMKAWAIRA